MKKLLLTLAVGAACSLLIPNALAVQITGGISLAGGPIVTNTGNLATATSITSFGTVNTTAGATGSYAVVPGGTAVPTTTGFTFLPALVPAPVLNVWSFVFAGLTYSFDLTSIQSVTQGTMPNGTQFLEISGMGTLHITGFDSTPGSYLFTANSAAGTFSFSSSNGANPVPDGGATIALLGLGIAGVAGLRRKMGQTK